MTNRVYVKTVRIPMEIWQKLQVVARREHRTTANQIIWMLRSLDGPALPSVPHPSPPHPPPSVEIQPAKASCATERFRRLELALRFVSAMTRMEECLGISIDRIGEEIFVVTPHLDRRFGDATRQLLEEGITPCNITEERVRNWMSRPDFQSRFDR